MDDFDADDAERVGATAELLDTLATLCALSCQSAVTTGDTAEWTGQADYTAYCLSCLAPTRDVAERMMDAAAQIARCRIGDGVELDADEFLHALTLTADYAERVLARMPAAA